MLFRLLVWYLVSQAHVVTETTLDPVPDRQHQDLFWKGIPGPAGADLLTLFPNLQNEDQKNVSLPPSQRPRQQKTAKCFDLQSGKEINICT